MVRVLFLFVIFYSLLGCSGERTNIDSEPLPKDIEEQLAISMEAYKQTPSSFKLTSKNIVELSDDSLLKIVTENLHKSLLNQNDDQINEIRKLNHSKQTVFIIEKLNSDVGESGLNQYYLLTDSKFMDELPNLLRKIGATQNADLIIKANEVYKKESLLYSENSTQNEKDSRTYPVKKLYSLDTEFRELNKTENLKKLLASYIRNNPKDFVDN